MMAPVAAVANQWIESVPSWMAMATCQRWAEKSNGASLELEAHRNAVSWIDGGRDLENLPGTSWRLRASSPNTFDRRAKTGAIL